MRADKDELWKQVEDLLRGRPGWSLQAMSTPGAPRAWCFGSGGETEVSVTVDRGSISVYLLEPDVDVTLGSTSELVAWLTAHKPGSLKEPKGGVVDKLKRAHLFEWE